jgi:2-polyprenyl-3-methyl-5-hydroxy-6-metoxy-1,4-benzoquinol methylase
MKEGKKCHSFNECCEPHSLVVEKNGWPIEQCNTCGHRHTLVKNAATHVTEVYSDAYFFEGGQGYPNYLNEKDILLQYGRRYAALLKQITAPGKMLDVGSAAGFILKGFQESGWECEGLEPNAAMAQYGNKELGLNIQTGNLENFVTGEKYDLVTLIQVIGHFTDVDTAISKVAEMLKPGGYVLVESWDMDSQYAKLMGKHWHEYSPPSVINWFSDKTLKQLFAYYGFELLKKGRPVKKINLKHGFSLLDESTPTFTGKSTVVKFFKNSIGRFNIIYPPFDVKWYIWKKH